MCGKHTKLAIIGTVRYHEEAPQHPHRFDIYGPPPPYLQERTPPPRWIALLAGKNVPRRQKRLAFGIEILFRLCFRRPKNRWCSASKKKAAGGRPRHHRGGARGDRSKIVGPAGPRTNPGGVSKERPPGSGLGARRGAVLAWRGEEGGQTLRRGGPGSRVALSWSAGRPDRGRSGADRRRDYQAFRIAIITRAREADGTRFLGVRNTNELH